MFYEKQRRIEALEKQLYNLHLKEEAHVYEVFLRSGDKLNIKAHGVNHREGVAEFWVRPFETVAFVTDYFYIKRL